MEKVHYTEVLRRTGILTKLSAYDPHIAGTPPLGIDLPASDLDILCHTPDPSSFASATWEAFSECGAFSMRQWIGANRPVVVEFVAVGWRIEIFGQALPVREQHGWRHFQVERRLLSLGGSTFRDAVMDHRRNGTKTEPAFSAALGLVGDPYRALLEIEPLSDADIARLLRKRGF
ncbi:MAG: DUF4269 domain-containing protein [Methylobacterium frigidaeris]